MLLLHLLVCLSVTCLSHTHRLITVFKRKVNLTSNTVYYANIVGALSKTDVQVSVRSIPLYSKRVILELRLIQVTNRKLHVGRLVHVLAGPCD